MFWSYYEAKNSYDEAMIGLEQAKGHYDIWNYKDKAALYQLYGIIIESSWESFVDGFEIPYELPKQDEMQYDEAFSIVEETLQTEYHVTIDDCHMYDIGSDFVRRDATSYRWRFNFNILFHEDDGRSSYHNGFFVIIFVNYPEYPDEPYLVICDGNLICKP